MPGPSLPAELRTAQSPGRSQTCLPRLVESSTLAGSGAWAASSRAISASASSMSTTREIGRPAAPHTDVGGGHATLPLVDRNLIDRGVQAAVAAQCRDLVARRDWEYVQTAARAEQEQCSSIWCLLGAREPPQLMVQQRRLASSEWDRVVQIAGQICRCRCR